MNLSGLRRSDVATGNPLLKEYAVGRGPAAACNGPANFALAEAQRVIRDGVVLPGRHVHRRLSDACRAVGASTVDPRCRASWSTCGLLIDGDVLMTARVDAICNSSARVERNGLWNR